MKSRNNQLIVEIYWGNDDISNSDELKMFAQYISNLFTFYLSTLNTKLKKVVIELSINCGLTTANYTFDNKIVTICKDFNLSKWQLGVDKLQIIFSSANQALEILFEELSIPKSILIETVKKIQECGFKLNLELCKTPILNKAKDNQAILLAEYEIAHVIIVFVFLFANGDSKRIPLFKTFPNSYVYNQLVKKVTWVNNSEIEIRNNSGEFRIHINTSGKVTPVYVPNGRDVNGIIEEIEFLTKEIYFGT